MKLNLSNLENMQRALQSSTPRTGDKKKDSIYFDFDRKKLFFHNDRFNGYVKFAFEVSSIEEKFANFFIDASKFFYVLKDMDKGSIELSFEENEGSLIPVFKKGTDIYKLSYIISDEEDFLVAIDKQDYKTFTLSEEDASCIEEASLFIDAHDDMSFNAVSVSSNKKVFGVTPTRFYEAGISTEMEEPLFIHKDVVKVIPHIPLESTYLYGDNKIIVVGESYQLVYNMGNSHSVIPSEEDKQNVVSKENCIKINKKEFAETLKFFDPFYITDSKPIRLTISSENVLKISTVSSYDVVEKSIPCESKDLSYTGKFNATIIKNAVNILKEETLYIYVNTEKIGAIFTDSKSSKEVVVIKYAETD